MKDEDGMMKEERVKADQPRGSVVVSILFLIAMTILVSCSSQPRPVSSTICDYGGRVLADLDTVIEFSPNQEWILATCETETGESKYIRFFRVDGSTSWKVSLDGFPWNTDENDPLARLISYRWMKDGESVYLRPVCCYDLSNHGTISDAYGLYLLNLRTGELSTVLSGENNDASPFSVSISPDERYLAYVDLANTHNILNISDLWTGKQSAIELDEHYEDIGAFVWTPDNGSLIFTAVYVGWGGSSLYILEMKSFALKAIVENDERLLFPTSKWDYQGKWGSWKDENTLFLVEMGKGKDWAVNIQTGVIVEDNSYDGLP